MATAPVYNQEGKATGTVELDPKVFGLKPKAGLIEQAIVTILANRRVAIAHTKTKGEVRGGGKKPWAQKGTGRARHGSIRSPQWKGGGVIFGPRSNRNFSKKMNIASKRIALLMALSDKAQGDRLVVVDDLKFPAAKTKAMFTLLQKLPKQKTSLLITPGTDLSVVRASRNIPGIDVIRADSLNVYDVVGHQQLIVVQPALPLIAKTFVK